MKSPSGAKMGFVLSLVVLSVLYGTAVGRWQWFPYSVLEQAVETAKTVAKPLDPLLQTRDYDRSGVRAARPEQMQPGLTLLSSSWEGPGGLETELRLMDQAGDVVHKWRVNREAVFEGGGWRKDPTQTGVHGSELLPNGDALVNVEYVGLARLNSCGEVQWTLREGNHHAVSPAGDGTFWTPAVSRERRTGSERHPDGIPGIDKPVWLDRILHVSGEGEILQDINVLDVLYANGLDRYLHKATWGGKSPPNGVPEDVTHINDVEPLLPSMADEYPRFEAGDLVISVRRFHLVFVFDPESLDVKWHASDPFIAQHDPDFIGDGWIGVFNNNTDGTGRGMQLGGTRIVALQPHTDSMEVRFPTPHSEPFYTAGLGKWHLLENGNMLLAETESGRVVEVDSTGRTVWEWVHPSYDEPRVPEIRQAVRHDLSLKDVAVWPCTSVDTSQGTSVHGD